ncbi:MAG: DNA mismatch repair protein MutS [Desulfovibrio sp.]|nr:MAG: DNA mismatch repair protein MutS [Desulfovibrio sp.]
MVKDPTNPFNTLDKSRFPKDRRKVAPREEKPVRTEPLPKVEDQEDLFAAAMHGVAPLKDGGRDVSPPAQVGNGPAPQADNDQETMDQLRELVNGNLEFTLEHTNEFILGQVKGVSPKMVTRLKTGAFSPEGHLDLHGMNALQAFAAMADFIREEYNQGKRCLLLIPGRGKNSPEGYGVLREKVQQWLTHDPFKRVVLAFCTAQPRHGGAGALYVLLRKYKKSQGKIFWDRTPPDMDLL